MTAAPSGVSSQRHVSAAVMVSAMCILPAFLTGALGVQLGRQFGVDERTLGAWVAVFFLASAAASPFFGRLVQRRGPDVSLRWASGLAGLALLSAGLAPTRAAFVGCMVAGGFANAMAHPAANLSLARAVPSYRLGVAFGVKQSAVPAATLLSGLAVPLIALAFGWRWAFGLAAVLALAAMAAVPAGAKRIQEEDSEPASPTGDMGIGRLAAFAVAGALGGTAAVSLATFAVPAGVAAGVAEGDAGFLFAVASGCGLLGRLALGWLVDRKRVTTAFGAISILLATGSAGFAILATGRSSLYLLGLIVGYVAGWTWPGLFHMSIVRANPGSPASATGVVQVGLSLGSGVGPVVFGSLVATGGWHIAWLAAAVAAVGASLATAGGARSLPRQA